MAIDRDRALDAENGIILDEESGGIHISSGVSVPTHSGLAGDKYFKTDDQTTYVLEVDGVDWRRVESNGNLEGGYSDTIYLPDQCYDGGDADGN